MRRAIKMHVSLALVTMSLMTGTSVFAAFPSEKEVLQDKSQYITANYDAQVKVNESKVIRDASRDLLGIDMEWEYNFRIMKTEESIEFSDNFLEVSKNFFPITVTRSGGTPSQTYEWRKQIGPYEKRENSVNSIANTVDPMKKGKTV